jgi:hypothetical protein
VLLNGSFRNSMRYLKALSRPAGRLAGPGSVPIEPSGIPAGAVARAFGTRQATAR